MKNNQYHAQLPVGDVTKESNYAKTLKDVLANIFNKGKSQLLKNAEQSIEIKKIHSKPITYINSEIFYEKRSIYSKCVPSYATYSDSDYRHSPSEYDMWEINCPSPKDLFIQAKNTVQIAGSRHVYDCNCCYASGKIDCNCNNGQENCPNCNGYGGWNCGTCGGNGEHDCSYCRGLGYTIRSEIVGYENNNTPIWDDVRYRCGNCGGSGSVRCGNCGGSGYITCGKCNGRRYITCRKCGGSTKITCTNCTGMGHFLDSINIDQSFDTSQILSIICDLTIDTTIYGAQKFHTFDRHKNDFFICEFINDNVITHIPTEDCLSNQFQTSYDTSSDMNQLKNTLASHSQDTHIRNYRIRVYQQQILEAEYEFEGLTYHLLYNVSTQETIMDKNPYETVAASMIHELKKLAEEEHYKTFLSTYKEFLEITDFDNVSYGEKSIKYYMKKLSIRSGIICVLAGLITQFIACLFSIFSIWRFLFAIACSIGISSLWKSAANDKKEIHYAILSTLVVIVIGILNLFLNFIRYLF